MTVGESPGLSGLSPESVKHSVMEQGRQEAGAPGLGRKVLGSLRDRLNLSGSSRWGHPAGT